MNESLVQWTLLNNLGVLGRYLDFNIASKKGQEITTDFGRIDFIVEDSHKNQLIVELETILNARSKLEYCFYQIINYKNVKFSDNTAYCILYASETNNKNKKIINEFADKNGILIRTYSLNQVKTLYIRTLERLSLSFGLALPKPKNYTICYLRWLNKILKPFLDFEMIEPDGNYYSITPEGTEYISNFNPIVFNSTPQQLPSIDLINEQKRLLLKILTNGNWTVHKVNIYWFLRFIEVTNGEWIPNFKNVAQEKLDLVNGLFGVSYKKRTMYELLNFTCNFCMELGMVNRIRSNGEYDRVFLTPLGIEINNIFSLDLQAKKSRLNLSFKYLE